eukprot:4996683-Heterocapsa_arctica.AAC.1
MTPVRFKAFPRSYYSHVQVAEELVANLEMGIQRGCSISCMTNCPYHQKLDVLCSMHDLSYATVHLAAPREEAGIRRCMIRLM